MIVGYGEIWGLGKSEGDDRRVRATRTLMDKGAQGQLGNERKAWRDRKSEKMHKWIADLESAPNFKPFWCIKNGRVRFLGHWLC